VEIDVDSESGCNQREESKHRLDRTTPLPALPRAWWKMTAIELFAGCGGAALGLHRAGYAHLACVERHPPAAATLAAAGFPVVESDVRAVDFARLFTAVPDARRLIEALAERGGNIGGAVARLGELLDAFGAEEVTIAIQEALAADAPHPGAVRLVLDRRRQDTDQPPPVAVTLPDDPRVRNVVVSPRTLHAYDQLAGKNGGHNG
jgi:hypothetical protein